ncbi:flagellar assembly protein H [compost metagenome]|jgi:flagellar assembly protein FliH|uniref:Flagellar assembly protein FliH n=1 Tax=Lelliottia aquatilis TaxID=2080838 RepID=A0ABX4ZXT8_9ENTR|nr:MULTISPECIES: flagellar assembly protein FliH [Lelliottia]ASV53643.1 Flagellar assembly protein FliH [Lelliottia jeotgali]MBL5885814.1 flagellar assembly protein H [Lelliottia aquatilis]NTZ47526.1 flagellar assembly protein H [Lelliottia aquatilis]POZ15378.1 flagellar assembly protein FliH [Lelliottia aquatilis]POZ16578.1 flagellar assembly protein FliH [Lelliottia sp. 7254-16]
MFKKHSLPLSALTQTRQAVIKPRLHKFPPLRKRRAAHSVADDIPAAADGAAVQEQLQQGFRDGLNQGFAQGMEEGKEEGYQEGLRLGFDEGVRKGRSEGKTQARQQFLDAAHPLDEIIQSMETFMAGYEQRRREELLQLVEKVSRQVIRCELTLHPTQILTLVEEALSALPQQPEQINVMLNSEEHRRISEAEPEKVTQWGLMADPELAPGECRVVTNTTEMDVGCQHRLDQCMDVLKETLLPESGHE